MGGTEPHGDQARRLVLTRDEAWELGNALVDYFDDPSPDPGWHHHLGDVDGEVILSIDLDG